ncbi:MAG: hypothetical protein JWN76_829 [Chitinophagaceae bacterium]|nr:hypothetical protein [Chitinophagaceae bacterium]
MNFHFLQKRLLQVLASLLFWAPFTGSTQNISFQPSILDFHVPAGSSQSQVVRVSNYSNKKMIFQAYLGDWYRDSSGGHHYFRPDTLDRSCAKWIKLNRNTIEIDSGKTEEIIVQMQPPADMKEVNQMKWSMLFLQTNPEQQGAAEKGKNVSTQVKEILRVGIHVYETPPNVIRKLAKADTLVKIDTVKNAYDFKIRNIGDVMIQCKANMELTDINTGQQYKLEQSEFPMFPDAKRSVRFAIPATVPKGKYSALAILDYGEDAALEAVTKEIEVQ